MKFIYGINTISISICRNEFNQRFGVTTAFLATHSGLIRWMNFQKPNNNYVADSRPEYAIVFHFHFVRSFEKQQSLWSMII